MKAKKIIELGTTLGLKFDLKSNFEDNLIKDYVVFDGCNGQRFGIDGKLSDKSILEGLGESLILYGKRLKAMEIHNAISINSD
jgi:hypothetical protein